MVQSPLHAHDVELLSFEGERLVLAASITWLVQSVRGSVTRLGHALALLPGPYSPR